MKEHKYQNSSQVKVIRYNSDDKILEIDYMSGKTYAYYDVPESTYEAAILAESIGKFVNAHVKPVFKYKQL